MTFNLNETDNNYPYRKKSTLQDSQVSYDPSSNSVVIEASVNISGGSLFLSKGSDIPSSQTIAINEDGNLFAVNGTTTIDNIGVGNWTEGSEITLHFSGTLTLSHGAAGSGSLSLSGSTNIITSTDTRVKLYLKDDKWFEIGRGTL